MRRDETRITTAVVISFAVTSSCAMRHAGSPSSSGPEPEAPDLRDPGAPGATPESSKDAPDDGTARVTLGPGFPESGPWVSFYGKAVEMGDLRHVARTYRIINIDADPGLGNFTKAEIAELRAGGQNRVLSYLNLGACEKFRTYWSKAPQGLQSCAANTAAQRGAYHGYPDEIWMDVSNADYQALILEHVAPRLAAAVDGFYLDNLEIVEHSPASTNGPCSAACSQGGLDLVRMLREAFPKHLIVMQNATSDVTRLGKTGGIPFPLLLDGVAHEEVYAPRYDESAEAELLAWRAMRLSNRGQRPFWIGVEDYVGSCRNTNAARTTATRAKARGFSPYASDESSGQRTVCFWD